MTSFAWLPPLARSGRAQWRRPRSPGQRGRLHFAIAVLYHRPVIRVTRWFRLPSWCLAWRLQRASVRGNTRAAYQLVSVLERLGHTRRAAVWRSRVLQRGDERELCRLAKIAHRQGAHEEALILVAAVAARVEDREALLGAGVTYMVLGKPGLAWSAFGRAAALGDRTAKFCLWRMAVRTGRGQAWWGCWGSAPMVDWVFRP